MNSNLNLSDRFSELQEEVNLDNFYSINIWVSSEQISLQGHFTAENILAAKRLGVNLIFNNERSMLVGESSDNKLRICLT